MGFFSAARAAAAPGGEAGGAADAASGQQLAVAVAGTRSEPVALPDGPPRRRHAGEQHRNRPARPMDSVLPRGSVLALPQGFHGRVDRLRKTKLNSACCSSFPL